MSAPPRMRMWLVKVTSWSVGAVVRRHPPFYVQARDLDDSTQRAYALLRSVSPGTSWAVTVTAAGRDGIVR